jgi:type I restriction enzyme R subunit
MNEVQQGAAGAAQLQREQAMRERGRHRAEKAIRKALERGEAAETPAEVQLAKRAVKPLADAIRAFCGPQKGAGRRHTAAKLLKWTLTLLPTSRFFYRRLLPLLEFGRERQEIDLSKVTLTHHSIRSQGRYPLPLGEEDEKPKLRGFDETGTGMVREKERALLAEIIAKINDLFEGDLTDDDRLVYVNTVLKGKLLESETLVEQAVNNTKEQFANSPDLSAELLRAIMDALAAHTTMSTQALNSKRVQDGLKDVLLGPAQLYEALLERAEKSSLEAD